MTLRVRAVSDEEREQLGRMARSRTVGAGLVRRAQIILHALDGLKVPEIGSVRTRASKYSRRPRLRGRVDQAALRMASTVAVRRRKSTLPRSAGTCWL